jgi:hypothetical protein
MRAMRNESSNEDHLNYQPAIHACVDNGKRLIRDAELLRDDLVSLTENFTTIV